MAIDLLDCEVGVDRALYRMDVTNGADSEVRVWVFVSVDSGSEGLIWGTYRLDVDPGQSHWLANTDNLSPGQRKGALAAITQLADVDACSTVVLGFEGTPELGIAEPVSEYRLDRVSSRDVVQTILFASVALFFLVLALVLWRRRPSGDDDP